jgi:hypothetical protein
MLSMTAEFQAAVDMWQAQAGRLERELERRSRSRHMVTGIYDRFGVGLVLIKIGE